MSMSSISSAISLLRSAYRISEGRWEASMIKLRRGWEVRQYEVRREPVSTCLMFSLEISIQGCAGDI